MKEIIDIFTDGSVVYNNFDFKGNGWAVIVPKTGYALSGKSYLPEDTITRMELQALIKALEYIVDAPVGHYKIHCDELSIVRCFKGTGSRKLHKDLWTEVHKLVDRISKTESMVSIEFLDRKSLPKKSKAFKYAQQVDHLAFVQANSLEKLN